MGRSESKQVVNQGTAQSAEDQANASSALASTNKSLADYSSKLSKFMDFGRSTYGAHGEFMKDQNAIATTTAAAGSNAIKGNIALDRMRTGENTAGDAGTIAESQRQAERDMTSQLANADAGRLDKLTAINEKGVELSSLPASVQASLYGTATGGSTGQLGVAGGAAKTPGFWDTFAPALAQGAGAAAAGLCSCEGSLVRLADGSSKPVELLRKGDWVWGPGYLSGPNEVLSDPIAQEQECWELETVEGTKHRGSATHTIALATGGYAYMPELEGKSVGCETGGILVKSVRSIGNKKVYPFAIGGSHCYLADGILVLA